MSSISDLTPGTWNVDPAHTTIGFTARHLMVTKVRGRFSKFSGAISVDEDPLKSHVEAEVDLSSVDTGDLTRDGHLRSADFFNTEQNREMTFKSTSLTRHGDDYKLTGDLTIAGITKSIDFDLEFEGVEKDPWGGTRAGFEAESEISRKEFGLNWNVALETGGVLVGDKVKIELDIEAVKAD